MIEFACADFTFPVLSHRKALILISLMDFKWVDIGLFTDRSHLQPADQFDSPGKKGIQLYKTTNDLGLGISDIFLQSSLDFSKFAINHPLPSIREGQRDMFKRAIEYTAAAGAKHFTGLPGVNFNKDSLKICIEELSWRAGYANKYGITYAVEPHFGSIMEAPEDAIEILKSSVGLTIALDHSHYTVQGVPVEKLRPLFKYASHMHARCAASGEIQTTLKRNTTDFPTIVQHIKEFSYTGKICLEYCYIDWGNMDRTDNVSETLLLRDLLEKLLLII